jgi:hypothetical protein
MIYTATDCAGNSASDTVEVRVPHSQAGGKAVPTLGFSPDGTALDATAGQFVLVVLSEPAKYKKDKKKNLVLVYEGVDATALDLKRTYVGNVKGIITPQRSEVIDINADGLDDLALYYSARALNLLIEECTGGTPENQWEAFYGPIGLQYVSEAGVDYLAPNIFELGPPVALSAGSAFERPEQVTGGRPASGFTGATTLLPSYPNPFNPAVTIPFDLATPEHVTVQIFDARGSLVRRLENDGYPVGVHQVVWDGRDDDGRNVATGVYFVRFATGSVTTTQKIVLIK